MGTTLYDIGSGEPAKVVGKLFGGRGQTDLREIIVEYPNGDRHFADWPNAGLSTAVIHKQRPIYVEEPEDFVPPCWCGAKWMPDGCRGGAS